MAENFQPFPTYDPQISGITDNGKEGVLNVNVNSSDLVPVAMNKINYNNISQGSATVTKLNGNSFFNSFDKTLSSVGLNNPAGDKFAVAAISFVFYGPTFGLRIAKRQTVAEFGVIIDGIPRPISERSFRSYIGNTTSVLDRHANLIVADNLGHGYHDCTIMLPRSMNAKGIEILSLLLSKSAGYTESKGVDYNSNIADVTALVGAPGYIQSQDMGTATEAKNDLLGLKFIHYYNKDTIAHTITVFLNNEPFWTETINPKKWARCYFTDLGVPQNGLNNSMQHGLDEAVATTPVKYFLFSTLS